MSSKSKDDCSCFDSGIGDFSQSEVQDELEGEQPNRDLDSSRRRVTPRKKQDGPEKLKEAFGNLENVSFESSNESRIVRSRKNGLNYNFHHLKEEDFSHSHGNERRLSKTDQQCIQEWAGEREVRSWSSKTLPIDLALAVRERAPELMYCMILIIVQSHIPGIILLTVYKNDSQEPVNDERAILKYTKLTGDCLTEALTRHVPSDFNIINCILSHRDFSPERLRETVNERQKAAKDSFGGPAGLNEQQFLWVSNAVDLLLSLSSVPKFLWKRDDTETMYVLHTEFTDAVLMIIQVLADDRGRARNCVRVHADLQTDSKLKCVLLEAARRLARSDATVIITRDRQIIDVVEKLREESRAEFGKKQLNLKALHAADVWKERQSLGNSTTYVFLLDCCKSQKAGDNWKNVLHILDSSNDL